MTDADALMLYATHRDPEAFAHLVQTYQSLVYGTCLRRLRHTADAEDATQETFVKLARKAGTIHTSVAAWLHAAALSSATDVARKAGRRRAREEAVATTPVVEDAPDWPAIREALDAALAELDDAQRGLIVERYFAGRTQADMATEHGVSQPLMSRRLKEAIAALRAKLEGKGFAIAGGAIVAGLSAEAVAAPATLTASLTGVGVAGVGASGAAAGAAATTGGGISLGFGIKGVVAAGVAFVVAATVAAVVAPLGGGGPGAGVTAPAAAQAVAAPIIRRTATPDASPSYTVSDRYWEVRNLPLDQIIRHAFDLTSEHWMTVTGELPAGGYDVSIAQAGARERVQQALREELGIHADFRRDPATAIVLRRDGRDRLDAQRFADPLREAAGDRIDAMSEGSTIVEAADSRYHVQRNTSRWFAQANIEASLGRRVILPEDLPERFDIAYREPSADSLPAEVAERLGEDLGLTGDFAVVELDLLEVRVIMPALATPEAVRGTWRGTVQIDGGSHGTIIAVIDDAAFALWAEEAPGERWIGQVARHDTSTSPARIDLQATGGNISPIGSIARSIYVIENDRLRLAYYDRSDRYPESFENPEAEVFRLQRAASAGPIRGGDLLDVWVFELTRPGEWDVLELRVDDAGQIRVPMLGLVDVEWLSTNAAEQRLTSALREQRVVPDPQVAIRIRDASRPDPSTGLTSGDAIDVAVFELIVPGRWWRETLTLDDAGRVTLPAAGAVTVSGLTLRDAEAAIMKALEERGILRDATVTVNRAE